MNCIETKENIEALLDNELDDAEKDAIEHHLWICSDCRDLREQRLSLSSLLQVSRVMAPSADLDNRVINSFRKHHASKQAVWRRLIFGSFIIPKPAFALVLILALAGLWAAFQAGKISSSNVFMTPPSIQSVNEIRVQAPAPEKTVETVVVEVPVVKEKIVTRTIFVREQKNNKNEKNKTPDDSRKNNLPLYSSTVAENGYFTDVSLKGFQPSAEIGAKIIKEEKKEDEK